ncbi:MAG: ABC transporter permease [Gammaproteobacteria bacterium]|nr:ABC transporter permease [Gammaproteobacteria bacterium]
MKKLFNLFINEFKLRLFEMRQYWFETISSTIFIIIVFSGLFYGIKLFSTDIATNENLDSLVFGFFIWMFASSAYISVTSIVVENNQKGFVEQLFLCPLGFKTLILTRAAVELIIGYLTMLLVAFISMALTGNWLSVNFASLFLLLTIATPSLIGLGLILSGLAFLFKKVETITALMSILIIGLISTSALPINIFSALPFSSGASLARSVVLKGEPLIILDLFAVAANSIAYFLIGIYLFSWLEKKTRERNLIGQY